MDKITITTFTDPMMGLSYESEPFLDRLKERFCDRIEFRYVMAGLVRDVSDFMIPSELALEPAEGIRKYCLRLGQIYKDEESIGGLPINMNGFHLFDADHRSSYPLCIAYKAAQLSAPSKADLFLHRLRRATIVETRQTTREDELIAVASECGIDAETFTRHMRDGSAEAAFTDDLRYTRSLGIYGLPAYIIQCGERSVLAKSLLNYEGFVSVIKKLEGQA